MTFKVKLISGVESREGDMPCFYFPLFQRGIKGD